MGRVLFAPPHLGPFASDPKPKKIGGVQFWESPFWFPRGHLPFLQFWTPEHQRTTWTTLTPTDTQRFARKPVYLGANLN